MKKLNLIALTFAALTSQTGCIGPKPDETDNPYATAEIQEKLAKQIDPALQTVPKDYFETLDYGTFYKKKDEILSVLNTPEEKQFWQTLAALRMRILHTTSLIDDDIEKLEQQMQDESISPNTLAAVLAYEQAHPYTPDLAKVHQAREYMIGMALGNMPIPPDEEETKAYIERWGGKDTAAFFQKNRTETLNYFEQALQQRKSGQKPQSYEEIQRQLEMAEYTVHFAGSALYPAELIAANFLLSLEDELVYSHPKTDIENTFSIRSARPEAKRPLPYTLVLLWYSIAENKIYKLEEMLPRETLKEKIINDNGNWDALLFALKPHGKVTLYVCNQANKKTEEIASFEAEEEDTEFADFRQFGAQYDGGETPSATWEEYQQRALSHFPEAAENLKQNGLTANQTDSNLPEEQLKEAEPATPSAEAKQAAQQAYQAMGISPLHYALLSGETDNVKELIASGADVNAKAPNMGTPLLYACTVGNAEAARLLVNAKADVNAAGDTGYTPLMMACQTGNKELAELLVTAGADVNAKHVMNGQETGLTPLKIAQDGGHSEIAALLVSASAH